MGHNGGFNPYRDANGRYATPEGAGKAGPKRGAGGKQAPGAEGFAPKQRVRYAGSDSGETKPFTGKVRRKLPGGKEYIVQPDGGFGGVRVKAAKLQALSSRTAPSTPNITRGTFTRPSTQRYNPTGLNQALADGRAPFGFKANTIGYRGKGQDIYGDHAALKKSRPPR